MLDTDEKCEALPVFLLFKQPLSSECKAEHYSLHGLTNKNFRMDNVHKNMGKKDILYG